jgi:hypothetical protein
VGDRSWGIFTVPNEFRRAAEEVIAPECGEECDGEGFVRMSGEANGGGYNEAEKLRELRIPFEWSWDECGSAYPSGKVVFMPGIGEGDSERHGPCAIVDRRGQPNRSDVKNAIAYWRVKDAFDAIVRKGAELCKQHRA